MSAIPATNPQLPFKIKHIANVTRQGINAIIYYAPTIFGSLGLNASTTSLLATGVLGVVDVIFTLPAILFVDAWGRRIFLMVGALGMMVSHIVVAGITGHYDGDFQKAGGQAAGWVGVVFIWVSWKLASDLLLRSNHSIDIRSQLRLLMGTSRLASRL